MADTSIQAATRQGRGKNESRRLRRLGRIPGVVYGPGGDSVPVTVPAMRIFEILHSERGENTLLTLTLDGGKAETRVLIKDFQLDPVSSQLLHADFVRIDMTREIEVSVPVILEGQCLGVKTDGGILDWTLREIRAACLPGDIPDVIRIDVTNLRMNQTLRVKDVAVPEKVRFLEDPERAVAHVEHGKAAEEAAPAVEGAAEEIAEPEVIKKGKEAKAPEEGEESED